MEDLRAIAVQTVAQAKIRRELLTGKALQCHDVLAAKERQLSALQREVDVLRQQKSRLVAEIKQEACLMAFGSECDWKGYESCDGRRVLQRAWNGLSLENKWKKNVILTVFFRYFDSGRKMPLNFFGGSWEENAPDSIRDDRDIALCRLSTNHWNFRRPDFRSSSFLLDRAGTHPLSLSRSTFGRTRVSLWPQ